MRAETRAHVVTVFLMVVVVDRRHAVSADRAFEPLPPHHKFEI
jgi:hypothetical protein